MPDVESPRALILASALALPHDWVRGPSFFANPAREFGKCERDPGLAAVEAWACGMHGLWFFLRLLGLALLCVALCVLFDRPFVGLGRVLP